MEFEALDFLSGIFVSLVAAMLHVLTKSRRNLRKMTKRLAGESLAWKTTLESGTIPADWIKSGAPVFMGCQYAESPDQRSSSGIWSCSGPATFEWQFGSDETVFVLDGRVEIDYLGQHFVLEPGGTALFYAGTRAMWCVPHYVRKSYMVHYPNRLVRLARRVLGLSGRR